VNGEQAPRVAVGRDIVVAWQSRHTGTSQIRVARDQPTAAGPSARPRQFTTRR
jgi:hypothetical protein